MLVAMNIAQKIETIKNSVRELTQRIVGRFSTPIDYSRYRRE